MFKVKEKTTGIVFTVYGISGQYFLIWDEAGAGWRYGNMMDYEPLQKQGENICISCGASIPEGWKYCNTCWENMHGGN